MTDPTLPIELRSLHVYPVKSCAGVDAREALLIETGLEFDRAWMLVDADGEFVSQRELPRMAQVATQLRHGDLVLRAPGMLALHLALDGVEQPTRVRVWDDEVAAYDMGALAAQWFSDFLRQPAFPNLRLVRFDPQHKRLSAKSWTGPIDAENAFSDGFPILVASQASLDGLNERLAAVGREPVPMSRFRPNLVIASSELDAHGEDHLDEIAFDTADGPVRLKLVKPCARCPIPDIDPATGMPDDGTLPKVSEVLAGYRADARVGGAVTFGMNAVIVEGIDRMLRAGQTGHAKPAF